MAIRPLTAEDRQWLETRARQVRDHFGAVFERHAPAFPSRHRLLGKYIAAVTDVQANGWVDYGKLFDFHNELSLAEALLECPDPSVGLLDYEVSLPGCSKTVDFHVAPQSGSAIYLDVKTIRPTAVDAWGKYEHAVRNNRLTPATHVELRSAWLGGELWHLMTAARDRFLQHSLGLEAKIRECRPALAPATLVLALFSNGFHWHLDELEDFVAFYRSGNHAPYDPLGSMEAHYITEKDIHLDRTIDHFAYFRRAPESISIDNGCWSVRQSQFPQAFADSHTAGTAPNTFEARRQ